jgi:hypothetical protein
LLNGLSLFDANMFLPAPYLFEVASPPDAQ